MKVDEKELLQRWLCNRVMMKNKIKQLKLFGDLFFYSLCLCVDEQGRELNATVKFKSHLLFTDYLIDPCPRIDVNTPVISFKRLCSTLYFVYSFI